MKIFVTGAAAYIGGILCVRRIEAGHESALFDNVFNANSPEPDRIERIVGARLARCRRYPRDAALVTRVFATDESGAVIHSKQAPESRADHSLAEPESRRRARCSLDEITRDAWNSRSYEPKGYQMLPDHRVVRFRTCDPPECFLKLIRSAFEVVRHP